MIFFTQCENHAFLTTFLCASETFTLPFFSCDYDSREWTNNTEFFFYNNIFYYYFWSVSRVFQPDGKVSAEYLNALYRAIYSIYTVSEHKRHLNLSNVENLCRIFPFTYLCCITNDTNKGFLLKRLKTNEWQKIESNFLS